VSALPPVQWAEQRPPAVEEITAYLREAVSFGDLVAGTALRQEEIADLFGVSHIPVREAFKILIGEGLLEQQRNRGVLVARMSAPFAFELTEYRALLEERLMLWAVPRLESRDIKAGRACLDDLDLAETAKERLKLAAEFHTLIYRKADRPFFLGALQGARNNLNRYWRLIWEQDTFTPQSQREHHVILAACEAGDAQLAAKEVGEHIRASGEEVQKYFLTAGDSSIQAGR
jgi:DNA-binding GntR family transcriptional regulator